MNENQHIIKFKHTYSLHKKLDIYTPADINVSYDYIFNLSNILYKLHTPDYYSKIHQNKGLI